MMHPHAHGEGHRHPRPNDEPLAAIRERNRQAAREQREDMLARINGDPHSYVFAVEARDDIGEGVVMQISSTLDKAREYCMAQGEREYQGEARYHVIPHLIDAPDDDTTTGVISLAVYGIRSGETMVEDLVDTEDE